MVVFNSRYLAGKLSPPKMQPKQPYNNNHFKNYSHMYIYEYKCYQTSKKFTGWDITF